MYHLRSIEERDADMVLNWRNSLPVRKMMFTDSVIPRKNHLKWLQGMLTKPDRVCLIFEHDNQPFGVVNANRRIEETNTWIWGCYLGDPGKVPGLGTKMGLCAMMHFYEVMKINIVIGEMVASNTISYKFNRNLGFNEVKELPVQKDDGSFVDSILFVQTKNDWAVNRGRLLESAGLSIDEIK